MKPSIPDVVEDFADYLQDNPAWGSLHIVLDDGNVSDDSVRWCIGRAGDEGDEEGARLGEILLSMSRTQRLKLPHAAHKALENRGPSPGI